MREPARKLRNNRAQIDKAHRHPHQQPADLLVFVRSDTPVRLNQIQNAEGISGWLRVNWTHAHRGECDKNSKNAARDARAKKIKHCAGGQHSLLLTRRKNLTPENRAEQKQRSNLQSVNELR